MGHLCLGNLYVFWSTFLHVTSAELSRYDLVALLAEPDLSSFTGFSAVKWLI
jgi:hypothetical protein